MLALTFEAQCILMPLFHKEVDAYDESHGKKKKKGMQLSLLKTMVRFFILYEARKPFVREDGSMQATAGLKTT